MEMDWVSSGDALPGEDQVQPLSKRLSHSQEGSWSRMLCIDESMKMRAAAFMGLKSRHRGRVGGLDPEQDESELESTGCPCWRAGSVWWPDGESIKCGGVSYILGTREKCRFPDLATKSALGCPYFSFS